MKRLTIDIPERLHRAVKAQCAMRGTKIADEIRELLLQTIRKSTIAFLRDCLQSLAKYSRPQHPIKASLPAPPGVVRYVVTTPSSCFAGITVHRHTLWPRGLIPRLEPSRYASWRNDATFAGVKVSALTISTCTKTQALKDEGTQRRFDVAWLKRRVSASRGSDHIAVSRCR